MKRIHLLRHGKASKPTSLDDSCSQLAPKGIWAAEAVANHCKPKLRRIELAICSPAIRARETLRLFERHLPPGCKIELDDAMYQGDSRALLETVRSIDDSLEEALLVGHNPGLTDFARMLCTSGGSAKAARRITKGLKTGSLATLDLAIDRWSETSFGLGRPRAVIRPKDLR